MNRIEQHKHGKLGSVANTSLPIKNSFKMEDLAYVFSYKETISGLYKKLLAIYERSQHDNYHSYKKFAQKNKIDFRLMPLLKDFGYCGDNEKWLLENPPRKGDAIFLQLKLRDKYRELKR